MIYAKTPQGQHEIETRTLRLPARLRSTLILVDGKRTVADLGQLVPNVGEVLDALLAAGLIAAVAAAPASAPTPRSAAPAAAAAPAREDLAKVRRDAVRALTDLLGPEAESLALRIERAADRAALDPLLQRAVDLVQNVRGAAAAADFAARFQRRTPD